MMAWGARAEARNISAASALGEKTPIAVQVGVGHTLDFSATEEQVFRGWIGDGGRCLRLSPSSPLETGASIINLRRIAPCQQVAGLPAVDQTTLTLVTLTPAGETNIYEFSIAYGATGDSLTRLMPSSILSAPAATRPTAFSGLSARETLDPKAVNAGLGTFELAADSPVVTRVSSWLTAIEEGQAHREAAEDLSLDWALLERLEAVGKRTALEEGSVAL